MRALSFAVRSVVAAATLIVAIPSLCREPQRYAKDGWALTRTTDRFTGEVKCWLRSTDGRIAFQAAAVGFHLSRGADTVGAWYRIDGGAPVRWQDRYPALIASGAVIDGSSLAQPTDGWVWVPAEEIVPAKMVAIRAADRRAIRTFRVAGFKPMLDAAGRLGCPSYSTSRD